MFVMPIIDGRLMIVWSGAPREESCSQVGKSPHLRARYTTFCPNTCIPVIKCFDLPVWGPRGVAPRHAARLDLRDLRV